MGAELSQQREERPRKPRNKPITTEVIKISPRDPDVEGIEAYGSVEITDRALQHALGNESQQNDSQISHELARQQEENELLRQMLQDLERKRQAESLAAAVSAATTAANTVSVAQSMVPTEEEINAKEKHFNETAKRVEHVFLSKHQPNVCIENEKQIIDCLASNPKQVLRCQNLMDSYKMCIDRAKSLLIKEQLGPAAIQ